MVTISDWWFGTFFIYPYVGNSHPNWLIFFRGVGQPPTTSPRLNGTLQVLIDSRFVPPHIPQVCGTRCDGGVLRLRAISVHCAVETEVPRGHAGETRGLLAGPNYLDIRMALNHEKKQGDFMGFPWDYISLSWMIAIICYHYYCI